MSEAPTRVLCVDDHELLLEGLQARLANEPDLELVARLSSAEGLVDAVRRHRADLVVIDISMEGPDPFEMMEELHRRCPEVKTVILSAYVRDRYLDLAFDSGAWGYLFKGDDLDVLVEGLRRVARGEYVFGPKVMERMRVREPRAARPPEESRLKSLSPRELEVLRMIGKGMSRTEIADLLHLSAKTVDTHRTAIMDKLDIHDRTELALFAVREGLVELE